MGDYSTEQFYAETRIVIKETFQVVEWMVVVVAMLYAGARTGSLWFTAIGWSLYVLLGIYILDCIMRALWTVAPSLGPNKPRSMRTMLAAACVLVVAGLGQQLTDTLVGHLLNLQLADYQGQESGHRAKPPQDEVRALEPEGGGGKSNSNPSPSDDAGSLSPPVPPPDSSKRSSTQGTQLPTSDSPSSSP